MAKKANKDNILALLIVVGIVLVLAGFHITTYEDAKFIGSGIIAAGLLLSSLSAMIISKWRSK
jgi:phosphatidylserine synthase